MENPIIFAGENPDDMNYPIGIQTFANIRETDFAYVDKTAFVYMLASLDEFAEKLGIDRKEMLERLKRHYDGYHFSSDRSVNVYNPFSLICAMSKSRLDDFWFATGTPTFLYKQMKEHHVNLLDLENMEVPASQFDASIETMNPVLPLLYQSGYLTIKGRADVVVFMKDATYVMELKIVGTAQEALEQINSNDYAISYQDSEKPVVKIGIAFSKETRTVSDWIIER